jgi:glycosyltransferase involved in cell wall biosynthesis
MKIVQLLPSLELGGMERLTVDLARQQKAEGHEPSIYCTSHPGQFAREAEAANVPVHAFGKTAGFSFRLIRDLVSRLAVERIWRHSVRWIDSLVFVSEGVRDFYVTRDRLSRRATSVIYNGIDVDKFTSRPAHPTSARPIFRVGSVGRLVPAKDHVTLIHSFAKVSAAIPAAELHILGDGPCRPAISQTAESLGIANRVFLHGAGLDVPGFLSTLDLFVLSSIDEGLPISLMEALAAGLPVVSTRLPGLTELAPDTVVAGYCTPGQPESLAEQILRAANRLDLPALGKAASRWAQRFAIRETWGAYQSVFEAGLAKKNRQRLDHLASSAPGFTATNRGH